ncbi:MAG: dihydroneopterin aldolase [Verrucomicrobiota bacterium]
MKTDRLVIKDLEVFSKIGVPDAERKKAQRLLISIDARIPNVRKAAKSDSIKKTVDYFQIYQGIHQIAKSKPRQLLETLAEELSSFVLSEFQISQVKVTVKKFIFKDAGYVAIEIERDHGSLS